MGEVVPFQKPQPTEGNGAYDVIAQYMADPDYFLIWLWTQGFKIVPVDPTDGQ